MMGSCSCFRKGDMKEFPFRNLIYVFIWLSKRIFFYSPYLSSGSPILFSQHYVDISQSEQVYQSECVLHCLNNCEKAQPAFVFLWREEWNQIKIFNQHLMKFLTAPGILLCSTLALWWAKDLLSGKLVIRPKTSIYMACIAHTLHHSWQIQSSDLHQGLMLPLVGLASP